MGKIRVQDLAKMMNVPSQELVFKLKSIGVRVEGDDAQIDTDTLQAILQGKQLPHPREVILRDEEAKATAARTRQVPRRRPPPSPLRPTRPRSVIHRVDSQIKSMPVRERPARTEETETRAPERPAEKAAEAASPAGERSPEKAPEQTVEAPAAGTRPERVPPREAPQVGAARPAGAPIPKPPGPATEKRPPADEGEEESPKRVKKKKRRTGAAVEDQDLAAYRGKIEDLEEAEEGVAAEGAAEPTRAKRRAERRQTQEKRDEGKVLAFKERRPAGPVMVSEHMTVREFADRLGVKAKDLIQLLFKKGVMANINHVLAPETALQLAAELGVEVLEVSFEEAVQLAHEGAQGDEPGTREPRAPVVTVMGHVDHGKTSLLDRIRKSQVAESEAGGITQHIGAYHVTLGDRKIVFLDTPGHEAFTMMRARGSKVTDLVVLVVAADDGVMPQTVEAIDHARAAGVPIVVAINKVDKANANPDRVKKELADRDLLVEDWGGQVVAVPVSALKGEGIEALLEMILLTADLLELKAAPDIPAQGAVLEARKEIGRGTVATLLVQNGTLRVGDAFVSGATSGRVRSMVNDLGERVKEAGPATPVEVAGFSDVPEAGDLFQVVQDESQAREIAEYRQQLMRRKELQPTTGKLSLEQLFDRIQEGEVKELRVVIKADVQGSVEVLREALVKLSTEKVRVLVIHSAVGAISTNDVLLASASDAVIIGFNVRPERIAVDLAEKEKVDIRLHTVIYEITDEIKKAMVGLLEPTFEEVSRGRAEVREIFKVPRVGTVAGCHVVEGVLPRNAQIRLLRDNVVVFTGRVSSLKRFKEDVSEVRSGFDCGISLEGYQDLKPGDEIEAFVREEVAQTL
ncbi:MAG TPA: translation initiation factor IF-2 [Thermoanaerobaculia bacterium]|nr:translation initiation factor IF-2 [Thermoanaerobaculia bacterium]